MPLRICPELRAGRLSETRGFWLWGGFSIDQPSPSRLQSQEGTGQGCSSRRSVGAGTQRCRATRSGLIPAGSHLSHLLTSVEKPLTQQPPLPGATPAPSTSHKPHGKARTSVRLERCGDGRWSGQQGRTSMSSAGRLQRPRARSSGPAPILRTSTHFAAPSSVGNGSLLPRR